MESLRRPASVGAEYAQYPAAYGQYNHLAQASPSAADLHYGGDLGRPQAPFMGPSSGSGSASGTSTPGDPAQGSPNLGHSRRSSMQSLPPPQRGSAVYHGSAAAVLASPVMTSSHGHGPVGGDLPRTSSVGTFRAPFLSPASRPNSSFWAPPSYPYAGGSVVGGSGSQLGLGTAALKHRPPMPSSRLASKLTKEEKPWIGEKDTLGRVSWWLTVIMMFIGIGAGAVLCWRGYVEVPILQDSKLCAEYISDFGTESLSGSSHWKRVVGLGGFGNGEFEIMTNEDKNSVIKNGKMYIIPTLTSDDRGKDGITGGDTYDLGDDCTDKNNASTCSVSPGNGVLVPPVKSARLTTESFHSIAYGKVEIKAKLPRGDWLWPAIWMLPDNADGSDTPHYGPWPLSGEIDVRDPTSPIAH
jgi:hypothetical protein